MVVTYILNVFNLWTPYTQLNTWPKPPFISFPLESCRYIADTYRNLVTVAVDTNRTAD